MVRLSPAVLPSLFVVAALTSSCQEDPGGFGDAKKQGHSDQPIDQNGKKQEALPPDFSKALTLQPTYDKATGKLVVTLKLTPGFHAYGPGEEIGKPVELVVAAQNGWQVQGKAEVPAGRLKDLGDLGKSMILEGDVPLTAVVQGGTGTIQGEVKAQVCTDSACDRPKSHKFEVPTA